MITVSKQPHTIQSDILPPLSLRISHFPDEKEYTRFIKNVVSLVRHSYEYKLWTKYVKDDLGHNICALSGEVSDEVTIEIHHHPLCLFEIVEVVVNSHIIQSLEFCTADIMKEVLELHFENKVGYIPLCSTLHEKYHNGYLQIPIDKVQGNWQEFLKTYPIPDHIMLKVNMLANIKTTNHKGWIRGQYNETNSRH